MRAAAWESVNDELVGSKVAILGADHDVDLIGPFGVLLPHEDRDAVTLGNRVKPDIVEAGRRHFRDVARAVD